MHLRMQVKVRISETLAQPTLEEVLKKAVLRPHLGEAVAPRLEPGASYQMPWAVSY